MLHRLASALTLLVVSVSAQQNFSVAPSDHADPSGLSAALPGRAFTLLPFGVAVGRVQFLYESWDLGIPHGATITHVGFMPDTASGTGGDIDLEIFAGTSAHDVETMTQTFASNYSGVQLSVLGRRVLSLPSFTPNRQPIWIALDRPFAYDATQNLILDYMMHGVPTPPSNYALDEARLVSPQRTFGVACPASTGVRILMSEMHIAIGTTWRPRANAVVRGSTVTLMLGLSTYEPGIPLDFIGSPGCELSVQGILSLTYQVPTVTNTAIWAVPIPNDLGLIGQTIASQVAMLDPPANALGVVTGSGTETTMGVHPRIARISTWRQNQFAKVAAQISRSQGLITLFGWQ